MIKKPDTSSWFSSTTRNAELCFESWFNLYVKPLEFESREKQLESLLKEVLWRDGFELDNTYLDPVLEGKIKNILEESK